VALPAFVDYDAETRTQAVAAASKEVLSFADSVGAYAQTTYNTYGLRGSFAATVHTGYRNEYYTNTSVLYQGNQGSAWIYDRVINRVSFAWPSDAVCASGLVSRVRVYAVVTINPGFARTLKPAFSNCTEYTGESWNISDYEQDVPGGAYVISRYPDATITSGEYHRDVYKVFCDTYRDTSRRGFHYTADDLPSVSPYRYVQNIYVMPSEWILSELADITNPTERPHFEIGTYEPDITGLTIKQQTSFTRDYMGTIAPSTNVVAIRHIGQRTAYQQTIYVAAYVVVVDWNYTRFADGGTNNVAPYKPAWMD
jgi:hypothetical protein